MIHKTILIIDDDPLIRMALREIIVQRQLALRVVEASDGADALLKIKNQVFDLIICDNHMPKLTGLALLKEEILKNKLPPDKVILLSGCISSSDVINFKNLGIKSILTKPIQLSRFLNELTIKFIRPPNEL